MKETTPIHSKQPQPGANRERFLGDTFSVMKVCVERTLHNECTDRKIKPTLQTHKHVSGGGVEEPEGLRQFKQGF